MDARQRDANIRDRMFTALFYRVALTYARAVPQSARRLIEFLLLVKVTCKTWLLLFVIINLSSLMNQLCHAVDRLLYYILANSNCPPNVWEYDYLASQAKDNNSKLIMV